VHQVAVRVAQDLHLDVARAAHQLLEIDLVVAEGGQRPRAARPPAPGEVGSVSITRMPRPPPPQLALSISGIADRRRQLLRLGQVARQRRRWPASPARRRPRQRCARRHLVAQRAHHLGVGPMKRDAGGGAGLGEVGFSDRKP
jgi:hypothetical protein